jgi:hypothetical protein
MKKGLSIFERHPKMTLSIIWVISLIILEAGLRISFHTFGSSIQNRFKHPHDEEILDTLVHHNKTPNTKWIRKPGKWDSFEPVQNEINSYGMRGPELQSKSVKRVVIIGDSFIEADEVAYNHTFAMRLNHEFKGKIEFLAHGVSSWAPTTEFSWIHHKGLKLQPDEIFLFICWNDLYPARTYIRSDAAYQQQVIWNDGIPVRYLKKKAKERLESPVFGEILDRFDQMFGEIQILNLIKFALGKTLLFLNPPPSDVDVNFEFSTPPSEWTRELKKSAEQTITVIEKLHTYLEKRNIHLVVTLIPNPVAWKDEIIGVKKHDKNWSDAVKNFGMTPEEFSLPQDELNKYLAKKFTELDIEWFDLNLFFKTAKRQESKLLYNNSDGHWNRFGHETVFYALKQRYLK